MENTLCGMLGCILGIGLIFLFFYLLQLFCRSIDNNTKQMIKDNLSEEDYKLFEKNYYGLEDACKNKP